MGNNKNPKDVYVYRRAVMTDRQECGDEENIYDCIARLTQRDNVSSEGRIIGSTLRLFLREHWQPLKKRFEEHIVDETTYREKQAEKDAQRDKILEEIKLILLDPSEGIVRRQNDENAAKTGKKQMIAIVLTFLTVGAGILAMLWHLMQIIEKLAGVDPVRSVVNASETETSIKRHIFKDSS